MLLAALAVVGGRSFFGLRSALRTAAIGKSAASRSRSAVNSVRAKGRPYRDDGRSSTRELWATRSPVAGVIADRARVRGSAGAAQELSERAGVRACVRGLRVCPRIHSGAAGLPPNEFGGSARRRSVAGHAPQGSACGGRGRPRGRRERERFDGSNREGVRRSVWRALIANGLGDGFLVRC